MTLNPTTGVISGTPTTAGTYAYTAKVVNSLGNTASTPSGGCTITVLPTGKTFSIGPSSMEGAITSQR